MRLNYSPTSPYVRKVLVFAIETRLDDVIELVPTDPWQEETTLVDVNPLGKVPTLECDDGMVLFNSPLICEYLDSIHGGRRLTPIATPARWHVLRFQAAADGIFDAAVSAVIEGRRAKNERSEDWVARQRAVVSRTVTWIEQHFRELEGGLSLGQIAVGCALAYLDFRLPDTGWRDGHPKLAQWYESFAQRDSMQTTEPPVG